MSGFDEVKVLGPVKTPPICVCVCKGADLTVRSPHVSDLKFIGVSCSSTSFIPGIEQSRTLEAGCFR